MVCLFFVTYGHMIYNPLKSQHTVFYHWFTTICLPKLLGNLRLKLPKRDIKTFILHVENASVNNAQLTVHYIYALIF